ncbi:hypothetical protein [Microbacterium sp. 22242]|uniref:hypothetical protein n=1 Tax=Microbacterium sp. 22242 TaxID=3453896 RepID=UPI003F86E55E
MSAPLARRTIIKSAAWSLPVIAAVTAVPLAAASAAPRTALRCERTPNHGHGGGTGNGWWTVSYSDGTAAVLSNGTVMSDPALRALCKGGPR